MGGSRTGLGKIEESHVYTEDCWAGDLEHAERQIEISDTVLFEECIGRGVQ